MRAGDTGFPPSLFKEPLIYSWTTAQNKSETPENNMKDSDQLRRFLFDGTLIRGEWVRLDASWQAALDRHDYPGPVARVLGEALAAIALLSATIKYSGALILQVQGSGPLTLLVVQVSADHSLRGMAEWNGEVPDASLHEMCRDARLVITVESNSKGERFQSIISVGQGSLADALDSYFEQSEQLRTRLWLATSSRYSTGLLLQEMPATEHEAGSEEHSWEHLVHLAETVTAQELLELPMTDVLYRLYHQEHVRLFEPEPVSFRCSCSRTRVGESLRSLGQDEMLEMVEEQAVVSIDCGFCKQHYEFDRVDVMQLFTANITHDSSDTTH